jgi:hypothetical protein
MKKAYHSALKKELNIDNELYYRQKDDNIAFQHDITEGIPLIYNQCDVLYSEVSWSHGYNIFAERAKVVSSTYLEYINILIEMIKTNKSQPIFLIVENKIKHLFTNAISDLTINQLKLHSYPTTLIISNYQNDFLENSSIITNYDLLYYLAQNFNKVGDFCCGYGNTAKIFKQYNKNFICSDINPKCIYYIAKELMEYEQ